jgi:hypothetical protein
VRDRNAVDEHLEIYLDWIGLEIYLDFDLASAGGEMLDTSAAAPDLVDRHQSPRPQSPRPRSRRSSTMVDEIGDVN